MAAEAGELDGRAALVTGGTRGLGRASAQALRRAGAQVAVTGRGPRPGDLEDELHYVQADQGDLAAWPAVVAEVQARFGRLDIAVLNAGIGHGAPVAETTLADFDRVNAVNLKGAYFGLQHAVAAIRAGGRGGAVVLVSSVAGRVGVENTGAYTASKGGLRLLAKAAALELGPEAIRVNSLHPGAIRTDLLEGLNEGALTPMIPLGELGTAEDVAQAVLFLASDRSRFMTGAELAVDGGWMAR